MIKFIKVTGNSLSPFFLAGDYVLSIRSFRLLRKLKPGDIIVFNQSEFGVLIKKVTSVNPSNQSISVSGTHPDSIDSTRFGPINTRDVIGKVVWHIKRSRRLS